MRRTLGKTGLSVSPVAFGAFKIGRNEKIKYDQGYALPTEQETARLLGGVLDLGINLIDTAPAYGISEERIGTHLAHRRSEFVLSTKVGETFENGQSAYDFSKQGVTQSVERSLKRLHSDVLDLVFIHSDGRDRLILQETDVVEALVGMKRKGLIRSIGMSGKTTEGARMAMEWCDVLMVEYHPQDPSHAPVIEQAKTAAIGVLVKKPLASGKLPPAQAIPFALKSDAVASLVIGGLNLDHIRTNLEIARRVTA